MDRIGFLGFVLLLRDISRLDRYSTRQWKQQYTLASSVRCEEHVGERTGRPCAVAAHSFDSHWLAGI